MHVEISRTELNRQYDFLLLCQERNPETIKVSAVTWDKLVYFILQLLQVTHVPSSFVCNWLTKEKCAGTN
jgi:hypothetical protein